MSLKFSEELKEAIMRAKGTGCFIITIKDGEAEYLPDCFDIVKQTEDKLILKVRRPGVPTPEKIALVDQIVSQIKPQLESSITDSVRQALLEKPTEELVQVSKAKEAKVERRRGCFFLMTEETEHLL